MPLKILTWNINGIRAGRDRGPLQAVLDSLAADVICLQETKVTRDMLDEPTAIVDGYDSYFAFSRRRSGYSGTANYCTTSSGPEKAEEGLTGRLTTLRGDTIVGCYGNTGHFTDAELEAIDAEGRCVITQHRIRLSECLKSVAVINVYVPRSGDRQDRLEYKLRFLSVLQSRAETLLQHGIHVIILGDLNLTHKKIDNCDPDSDEDYKQSSSRKWLNNMLQKSEKDSTLPVTDGTLADLSISDLQGSKFSDVFRILHPGQPECFTNWNTSTDARLANYGRRLDYILVDTYLAQHVKSCDIMADFPGSDHCPVVMTLNCDPIVTSVTPALCSRLMPEFKGKQQKLSSFFSKANKAELSPMKIDNISRRAQPHQSTISSAPSSVTSSVPATLQKFSSAPNCSLTLKHSLKRGAETISNVSKSKAAKLKKEDSLTKQKSLTSFFVRKGTDSESKSWVKTTASEAKSGILSAEIKDGQGKSIQACQGKNSDFGIIDVKHSSINNSERDSGCVISEDNKTVFDDHSVKTELTIPEPKPDSDQAKNPVTKLGNSSQAWKCLLKGLAPPPLCPGHKEPCVLKTVKKAGQNKNRQFYTCPRPDGAPGRPEFRCNFFQWLDDRQKKKT